MLDIKRIRENFDEVTEGLQRRGASLEWAERARDLDAQRRVLVTKADELKTLRNSRSKEIGTLKKAGRDTAAVQADVRAIGDQITALDTQLREIESDLEAAMLLIPNVPCATIPTGPDASANRVVRIVGEPPTFDFKPLDHIVLGERLGLFDLPRGAKITGSGFPLMLGAGSRLQRALIQYMLDMHTERHGYTEMLPPFIVNSASMRGTGQIPKMADDMYHCEVDDLWLIPTAEVPVTNYFRDEILDRPLPIYLTAYTPCFRREAGSAGKETRGILRVHQFDKVEMVKFVEPETSYDELETLVANAEEVLTSLGLHYRVLELCSGDISFSAAKCYDIELWAPGQQGWLEVSSCSNFEDFQARRLNCRYRDASGKTRLVHTLNGSGVALPRLIIAILEQCQQADGSVLLPEALHPYLRGLKRLEPQAKQAD
jgi:seryl-tRNA synthetase